MVQALCICAPWSSVATEPQAVAQPWLSRAPEGTAVPVAHMLPYVAEQPYCAV